MQALTVTDVCGPLDWSLGRLDSGGHNLQCGTTVQDGPKEKLERGTRLCRGCLMMCGYGGLAWLSRLGTLGRLPVLGTPFRLGDRLPPGD